MSRFIGRPTLFVVAALIALATLQPVSAQRPAVGSAPAQASAQTSAAQAPAIAVRDLSATLPVDPQVTIGRFDNGLQYVIRTNKKPEKRAELRLVVNVGSILEDDDQLGLAHFVEHMAFNGTRNFPKQAIVTFMESIGMRFGPSVNAFTSFDETVYMLQVPTDTPSVLDRAMLVLEDWARAVTFDPTEIDKERGVILEEWRLGRGAGARMQDQQFPVLLKGSRYADRLPIGKPEILQNFKHDRLTQFYKDWYRPDLMTVIAVGDFDQAAVERLIRQHFAAIPAAPASARRRATYDVPEQAGTLYAVATDKEATNTSVSVYAKSPARDPRTGQAYRAQIVEGLFSGMLSARLSEMAQKPDAPFMAAAAASGTFVRPTDAKMLNALVKEGGAARGLEALFTEAERVTRFGFTANELDRRKQGLLRSLERAVAELDNQTSADLASEYMRHVTQREPIPGLRYEYALTQQVLPGITLAEVNALARNWTPDVNRVVIVSAPEKPGLVAPDDAALGAAIRRAAASAASLTPYVDTTDAQPLLDTIPAPGAVVSTATREALGLTEWRLANGVRVVLKPSTFKEDEIVFRAFSPGGTSLASDADFIAASTASQVIQLGGVGKFSAIELRKQLTGKVVSIRPTISDTDEGVSGGGSIKDLETLFQLIYLTFTAPRADAQLFGVITDQTKAMLANQRSTPEFAFEEALSSALSQDHFRARPMTPEIVNEMSLEKSLAFYKDRFSDAGDFTFVMAGSFDLPTIKPLVERYLGGLPATGRKETWKDVGARMPTGIVERRVEKGLEAKGQAVIVFSGPFEYEPRRRATMRALGIILETRLRELLREDLGGTYGVSVAPSYTKIPRQEYDVRIDFGANPTRTDELVTRVFQEIEAFKSSGPTPKQLDDAREALRREFETASKQNGWWVSQISGRYQNGETVDSLFTLPEIYSAMTAADIQAAARQYLNRDRHVKVTLFPEKR